MLPLRAIPIIFCIFISCTKAPDPALFAEPRQVAPTTFAPTSITMQVPESWEAVPVDQPFYLAKWKLGNGGQATVSFLGPSNNTETITRNISRWIDQWEIKEESDKKIETVQRNGIVISELSINGTLNATQQVGGGEKRENWALVGAIAQQEFGPVYLKVLGPKDDLNKISKIIFTNFANASF
jgi:hypothetical protein